MSKRPLNKYGEWSVSGVKTCNKCLQEKPVSEFYRSRSYPSGYCKPCHGMLSVEYRRRSPAARHRARDTKLKSKFGITAREYEDMYQAQAGRCSICGDPSSWGGRRLSVDHCHKTGRVRALLCAKCNTGLGKFGDSLPLLQKAMEYLRSNGSTWGSP